jgi:hypothetical protein
LCQKQTLSLPSAARIDAHRPATDRYRVLTASKDWRFGMISRADVANFLVKLIDDRALIGTTPLLIS